MWKKQVPPHPQAPQHHVDRVSRVSVELQDGTYTYQLSLTIYEETFPHLQHQGCQELLGIDGLCQGIVPAHKPLLLLAVKSHPASWARRAALRRTWARPGAVGGYQLRPLFLLAASPDPRHMALVQQESAEFEDVLMWDFAESHHNLSLKERCFLGWIQRHCPQVAFIFKGDDDQFVNPLALTRYLTRTPNASSFIHGNIQRHAAVMRHGKYAVPRSLFPLDHYPDFASGGGFVMPGAAIPALAKASSCLPVFPLDDVYLGFLVLAAGLRYRHEARFRVWGLAQAELCAYRDSLVVHGVSPGRLEEVWRGIFQQHRCNGTD